MVQVEVISVALQGHMDPLSGLERGRASHCKGLSVRKLYLCPELVAITNKEAPLSNIVGAGIYEEPLVTCVRALVHPQVHREVARYEVVICVVTTTPVHLVVAGVVVLAVSAKLLHRGTKAVRTVSVEGVVVRFTICVIARVIVHVHEQCCITVVPGLAVTSPCKDACVTGIRWRICSHIG